ncbi:MAG: ABC transporter ATP-binding protein [Vicinamibacterales bacterium]
MIKALSRLLPYVLRVRRSLAAGLLCVLAATVLSLVSPWVLKYVVDGLVQGMSRGRLGLYALATVGLAVADGWFRYLMRKRLIGASRQIEYELRQVFFAHLERLPPSYFQANRTGDLMSRATNDLSAVRMMVGPALMYFASTALGFIIALVVMFWIDARLTWLALLPLPGVTIGTRYFGKAIHDRFERIQAQLSHMSAVIQEALAGVRVVRAYGQEDAERTRFGRANDEYVTRNRGLIQLQAAFYPTLTLCFGLSGLLVLWFGGRDVIAGRLTLGEFVAFSRYLVLLSWPLIAFGWVINLVQRGVASWERMLEVIDAPAGPAAISSPRPEGGRQASTLRGRIEARHLSFRYPGATSDALEDISFALEAGQTLALVGSTGCGKSTLVDLLVRLREPPRGTLFMDGVDICEIAADELRATIALVPQEPFLFSESIGGNIVFGLGDEWGNELGRARASEAAAQAALDGDIAGFPNGYDTLVGERGITLSGGQKQRVAIARALAMDARVLVLDDALSAVDTATEEAVLRGLRQIRQGRTCIIVSHRVSTVRDADLILVLDAGRVIESGTHDRLVAQGGTYSMMHERQLLEQEVLSA